MCGPKARVQPELLVNGVEQLLGKGWVRECAGLNCHIMCPFIFCCFIVESFQGIRLMPSPRLLIVLVPLTNRLKRLTEHRVSKELKLAAFCIEVSFSSMTLSSVPPSVRPDNQSGRVDSCVKPVSEKRPMATDFILMGIICDLIHCATT
jgi:hypothetical protein